MPSSAILLWQTCHISSLAPTMNLKNAHTNYLCLNRHVQILLSFYYNYQIFLKKKTHTHAFYLSLKGEINFSLFRPSWLKLELRTHAHISIHKNDSNIVAFVRRKKKVPCKAKEKSPPNRIPKEKNKRKQWKLGK